MRLRPREHTSLIDFLKVERFAHLTLYRIRTYFSILFVEITIGVWVP